MTDLYLTDPEQVTEAASLLATFGETAGVEAAIRASRSATIGNHIRFCHWRQVERLIDILAATEATGTIH